MKILVATPVYDGKLPIETVRCILQEQMLAFLSGDILSFQFLPSCSHPAMGRNQLARDFIESDYDRLIFLDADVTFESGSLIKIAKHPTDFVGGCYRFKTATENYPIGWLPEKELWANEHGLLDVASLPGGFLSLSKKVFERFKEKFPLRSFEHFGHHMHAYFQMPYESGHLYGEDAYFCKEWREMGEKVYLDPEIELTHWDFNRPYVGHIGKWLKSRFGGVS